MGEVFGAGMSHYPGFHAHPEHIGKQLVGNIARSIKNGGADPKWEDKANWPSAVRDEYGEDEGAAAGIAHRKLHQDAVMKVRDAMDAFNPDFVLIFGDDQYENFHDDMVPPFAVFAWDEVNLGPIRDNRLGGGNFWDEDPDKEFSYKGHKEAALYLANGLMDSGFDIAYSYRPLHRENAAHAFKNTLLYLDDDRRGFPYPVIPFHINCYGERFVLSRGGGGPVAADAQYDVKAPSPKRCFELGQSLARIIKDSPDKGAIIGSSSWSHGGLTQSNDWIHPDVEADKVLWEHLSTNDLTFFRDITTAQLVKAGQVEVPNWCAMLGAMHEMGQQVEPLAFAPSHIFNSSKAVALFHDK